MKKNRTFKAGLILALLVIAAIIASAVFSQSKTEDTGDIDLLQNRELEAYFLSQKKAMDLEANLDADTPIGSLYASIAYVKAMGTSEDDATKEAEDLLVEDQAFLWYAEKENFQVSESDLEAYMNKIISDAKKADNYPVVSAACEKAGMTYDEFVKGNADAYKAAYIKDHFYTEEASVYSNIHSNSSNEDFLAYWKTYKANVIKQFKKSTNYLSLEKVMNNCVKQIQLNKLSVDELKAKDIFLK